MVVRRKPRCLPLCIPRRTGRPGGPQHRLCTLRACRGAVRSTSSRRSCSCPDWGRGSHLLRLVHRHPALREYAASQMARVPEERPQATLVTNQVQRVAGRACWDRRGRARGPARGVARICTQAGPTGTYSDSKVVHPATGTVPVYQYYTAVYGTTSSISSISRVLMISSKNQ